VVPNLFVISSTVVAVILIGWFWYHWRTFVKEGPSYTAGLVLLVVGGLTVCYSIGLTLPTPNFRIVFAGVCVALTGTCLVFWGLRKHFGLSNVVPVMCAFTALLLLATWAMWDLL
jgi:hypothetical protein